MERSFAFNSLNNIAIFYSFCLNVLPHIEQALEAPSRLGLITKKMTA